MMDLRYFARDVVENLRTEAEPFASGESLAAKFEENTAIRFALNHSKGEGYLFSRTFSMVAQSNSS